MKYNVSEVLNIIKDRRNIKPEDFSTRKVHREIIEKMLDAARWAPTHGLTQPWKFTVFMENGITTFAKFQADTYKKITPSENFKLAAFEKLNTRPLLASAIISLGMQRQEIEKIPEIEEISAVACAVQNMNLVATSYGIATYWGSGGVTYTEEMKQFLGLKNKDKCLGFIYLGYPSVDWPTGQRRPIEYFTNWVTE